MYFVYIRSNAAGGVTDDKLTYKDKINICEALTGFNSEEEAKEWLVKNGESLTEQFFEMYEQGSKLPMFI